MECPACHTPNADGARFCAKCGALLPAEAGEGADPLIGTIVGGRFRIVGILGEGGMGRVYNGEQPMGTSTRKVAIKTLLSQYAKDPQVLARFMRECGTVSELEHPNTIKVYDFGQTDGGELYIAMELLSGVSLEKALESGALTPDRVDRILQQVCGSLQEAHDKGIVHRDLKPANIYLTTRAGEEDYVKVLDFGIAKRDEKHSKQEQKLTQQGTVLGTPPYMSPEQFKGQELDARSDIYSLGVMAYEMLTGRLPFDADTPWAWATQHMTAQPFPFETIPLGSQVPAKMKAAVMRALSKDKNQRQQTVREFFEEVTIGTPRASSLTGNISRASLTDSAGGVYVTGSNPGPMTGPMTNAGVPAITGQQTVTGGSIPPTGGHPQVPTGSGQVFPAPPPPAKKSGGMGAIIGIVGVLVVGGVIGAVVMFGGNKGGTSKNDKADASAGPATTNTATTTATTTTTGPATSATAEPSSTASADPSAKVPPIGTGPVVHAPPVDPAAAAACRAAESAAAAGRVPEAQSHLARCRGPGEVAARIAVEQAAIKAHHPPVAPHDKKCGHGKHPPCK